VIDVRAALAPERAALLDLLTELAPADWTRPTECPGWTVHGLALHILGDDLSLLSRQRDAVPSGLLAYAVAHPGGTFMDLLDGFNEQWVTAASYLSPDLVVALLGMVGTWSDDFYGAVGLTTISPENIGFFHHADPAPYWMLIAREYVERVIHQTQLRRALGAPDLPSDAIATTALVVVHALARHLVDLGAPEGTTVAIDLGSVGAWAWRRAEGGWEVVDPDPDADARITAPDDVVVPLLTRGIDQVADAVTIAGDLELALSALETIAPLIDRP
jgi:uncharacterized protein (TIGR03083 family)